MSFSQRASFQRRLCIECDVRCRYPVQATPLGGNHRFSSGVNHRYGESAGTMKRSAYAMSRSCGGFCLPWAPAEFESLARIKALPFFAVTEHYG